MAGRYVLLLLASVAAVQAQGNSVCAQWCADKFANPGAVCTSPAAQGTGPCYKCGPLKTVPTQQLCSGVCTDTATDPNNCGSCGHVVNTANDDANCGRCGHACASTETCSSGVCKPKIAPCSNPFNCGGGPTFCGTGPPGSLCVCFNTLHATGSSGTACLDVNQLGGCPPSQCTNSESCGPGKVCVNSCCGKTCVPVTSACPGASPPSRMFRRESIEELAASSPWLNSTIH